MSKSKFKSGFTLLETVIALAVITAAVVGPVYLITKGLFSSALSKNKLVASNLAQEGIETVRAVRENNIICNFLIADPSTPWSWVTDSIGSGSLVGSGRIVDAVQTDSITCNGKTLSNPQIRNTADCANTPLKLDAGDKYNYGSGSNTVFKRCVSITQPGSDEGPIPKADIADLDITVYWNEKGLTKNFNVKERIYNWR